MKTPIHRLLYSCYLQWVRWLWHYDVTQTPIAMSFSLIVLRKFLSGSCASTHHHQVDYHSLNIESDALCFHWLACKKNKMMYGLPWITICWPHMKWFNNDFHSWLHHPQKSLVNHLTRDQKWLFMVSHIQCSAVIMWSIFSQIFTRDTP